LPLFERKFCCAVSVERAAEEQASRHIHSNRLLHVPWNAIFMCFVRRRSARGAGETSKQSGSGRRSAKLLAWPASQCRFSAEPVDLGIEWHRAKSRTNGCRNMPTCTCTMGNWILQNERDPRRPGH
jgi:hypothetical protein